MNSNLDRLSAPADVTHPRPIRSFVLRQGRLSPAQARAIDTLGPRYCVPFKDAPLDFAQLFGNSAPVILEIGFGMGETTAAIAARLADRNFLGIEVHTPGVGALLKLIGERQLSNVRIVQHDAAEVLRSMIADGSLTGVHVFFPDPWPKKRHHKRRLIQAEFVARLADKLVPGGYLHLATDWQEYAEQMLEVLNGEARLDNSAQGFAPTPDYRTQTSFERKGLAKGHAVWDLVFHRR